MNETDIIEIKELLELGKRYKEIIEIRRAYQRKYNKTYQDTHKEAISQRNKAYRAAHKQEINEKNRKWRLEHPNYHKEWVAANPDKIRLYKERYKARDIK